MRGWKTLTDLAELILAKADAGKVVRLTPETARFVAGKLITADAKPTRNEVALMICSSKCERRCYACTGKANIIVQAYGERLEPGYSLISAASRQNRGRADLKKEGARQLTLNELRHMYCKSPTHSLLWAQRPQEGDFLAAFAFVR